MSRQFGVHLGGRGILLDRMLRVIRYVGHNARRRSWLEQVGRKDDDAGQGRFQHRQILAFQCWPITGRSRCCIEQCLYPQERVLADVTAHPCPLQRGLHRGLLARVDFVSQHRRCNRMAGAKGLAQVGLVSGADIQLAAQFGERHDAQPGLERGQGFKLSSGVGLGDEGRLGFVGVVFGLGEFEVVQRGIEQRDRPGARPGFDREPRRLRRNIKAHERGPDIHIQIEFLFQLCLEQRLGEGAGVLQVFKAFLNIVLRAPMRGVQRHEGLMPDVRLRLQFWRQEGRLTSKGLAPGSGSGAEPVRDAGYERAKVRVMYVVIGWLGEPGRLPIWDWVHRDRSLVWKGPSKSESCDGGAVHIYTAGTGLN